MKKPKRSLFLFVVLASLLSCKHTGSSESLSSVRGAGYRIDQDKPKLCTAIRGNGPLIWAHFGALSKILETEGLIEGSAGGSSASISTFLYESILANPVLWENCPGGACTAQHVADRAAFLLKTMPFWLDVAKGSKEGLAVGHIFEAGKVIKTFDVRSLDAQDAKSLLLALKGLRDLLQSSTIKSVVNKDFIDFISPLANDGLPTLMFRAREAKDELVNFGNFSAKSANILLRPGVLDFKAVAKLFGSIGDFYAGADEKTQNAWPALLNLCTRSAKGQTPWEIASTDCGQTFVALQKDFITRHAKVSGPKRIDDRVGMVIPAIASTAVLVGGDALLAKARDSYIHSNSPSLSLPVDSIRFGYTAHAKTIAKLEKNMSTFPDARSQRFFSLGTMFWGDVIAVSPAEPGLANALAFKDGRGKALTSFGGWSDLSPVMVLKAIDCERDIYVTREGEDSEFAQGVAALLGLGPVSEQLFSLKTSESSYAQALNRADAVYCTKWNDYSGTNFDDIQKMYTQSYRDGVLYTSDRKGAPLGCAQVK